MQVLYRVYAYNVWLEMDEFSCLKERVWNKFTCALDVIFQNGWKKNHRWDATTQLG